ncbi:potassium channel AKT2/3-like [Phaseolus vulgaris]
MIFCVINEQGRERNVNSALWDAIASKHYTIFRIIFQHAVLRNQNMAGELLCRAAKKNELTVMKDLIKQGLNVNSRDGRNATAIQVAITEGHVEMVWFLVMNGADVSDCSSIINQMLQKRKIGHLIEFMPGEIILKGRYQEEKHIGRRYNRPITPRVTIYRGHPSLRKEKSVTQASKVIRLPDSFDQLKTIAGESFDFDAKDATLMTECCAEIDCFEVIRDEDKIFFC